MLAPSCSSRACAVLCLLVSRCAPADILGPDRMMTDAGAEPGLQRRPMVDEFDGRGASLEGDFPESGPTGPVELPPAELGNLPEIAQVQACSALI